MREKSPKALLFTGLASMLLLAACGDEKVRVETRTEVLEVPMNSWGVKYRYYAPSEMDARVAEAGKAVVQILDGSRGGSGSGFFVNSTGVMVTAAHVIKKDRCYNNSCPGLVAVRDSRPDGANELFSHFEALLIDEASDVAMFQLRKSPNETPKNVPYLKISLKKPIVGETHWSIGHPAGATQKFSEFKPKHISSTGGLIGDGAAFMGNSGGPAIDPATGEVIGIVQAIGSNLEAVRMDGSFDSIVQLVPIVYFASALMVGTMEQSACGLPEATEMPDFQNPEVRERLMDSVIGLYSACARSADSRQKVRMMAQVLPQALDKSKVYKDLSEFKEFVFHRLHAKDSMNHLEADLKKNPQVMSVLAEEFKNLANRVGYWVFESEGFKNFQKSYAEVTYEVKMPAFAAGLPGLSLTPGATPVPMVPMIQKLPEIALGKACRQRLKQTGSVLADSARAMYNCHTLPEELSAQRRSAVLGEIQSLAASPDPVSALPAIDVLVNYVNNGGDPLTSAEMDDLLRISREIAPKLEKLREFMALDQLHFRLQRPDLFNFATLYGASLAQ